MTDQATEHTDLDALSPTEAIDVLLDRVKGLADKMTALTKARSYIPPMIDYLCGECGEMCAHEDRAPYRVHGKIQFYICPHCGSLDIAPAPDGD